MITVLRAPPFATVQDLGRIGHVHAAVPRAGALDGVALAVANLVLGNPRTAAGIEWGLGGGELRFDARTTFALAGAVGLAAVGGRPVTPYAPVHAQRGDTLALGPPEGGAWIYLAVVGGIDVPPVLGSRATYLPAKLGGLEGRLLRPGDRLPVGAGEPREGTEPVPEELRAPQPGQPIALLPGPDGALLEESGWLALLVTVFTLSRAVSRMGYRLEGLLSPPALPGDLPSAPACIGTLQLPPGGEPIVLLHDGPTVGGYPRIGVVATVDLGRLAQRRPGDRLRFQPIEVAEARARLHRRSELLDRLEPRG